MATKDPIEPVIEEVEVIEPPVETPPVEPELPVEEVVEEEEPEEPEEEPEEPKVSRREQLRIAQVLARVKEQQAPAPSPQPGALDYSELEATPEMIKQLEDDRTAAINAAVKANNSQLNTFKWETMLNIDVPAIKDKYPQLDTEDSEKFHPGLTRAIETMYLSAVGYDSETKTVTNPNIRYKDYVESVFELANEIAGEKIETSTKNIKRQAAQTGIRPSGQSAKRLNLNQSPNAMSDEELKAKIESDFKALGLG